MVVFVWCVGDSSLEWLLLDFTACFEHELQQVLGWQCYTVRSSGWLYLPYRKAWRYPDTGYGN